MSLSLITFPSEICPDMSQTKIADPQPGKEAFPENLGGDGDAV